MNTNNNALRTKMTCKQNHQGFTLVELMIAITLGFIVVGAVGYLYLSARQSFRTTDNMSRMQENARLAIETLARDVRMAGYVGCGNLQNATVKTIANAPVPNLSPSNALTGDDFVSPTAAYLGTTITRSAGDTISVMGAFAGGVNLMGNLSTSNAQIHIVGNPYGFVKDDVLVVSGCTNADIFKATTVSNGGGVSINLAHGNSTNTGNRVGTYGVDGQVFKMERYTYFIGTNSYNKPALYRTNTVTGVATLPQELVEDVSDMQIEYGMDTNADGAADSYSDATAITLAATWQQVVSARISLLLVSPDNNVLTSPQTYSYNGAPVTSGTSDKRMYQVLTSTIALRNRAP